MKYFDAFLDRHKEIYEAITIALAERKIRLQEEQYPSPDKIFEAFRFCDLKDTKVVILGQDPYHGPNQANGLAFSVNRDQKIPPSLKNIYKELKNDLNIEPPSHGDLTDWTKQGVLLLNTVLTVAEKKPGSHYEIGWEMLTDEIIKELSKKGNIVFILWGNKAQTKKSLIDKNTNFIIEAPHPSPFSANKGFFGSKPFSKTNEYLKSIGKKEIDWRINEE